MQFEQIEKDKSRMKELLFEWISNLEQTEFDQFCCEIIAMTRFFHKYNGVVVMDSHHMTNSIKRILPKVELIIEMDDQPFHKIFFYRWLETVEDAALSALWMELEDAFDGVRENVGACVVTKIYGDLSNTNMCWTIKKPALKNLKLFSKTIRQWKSHDVVEMMST